MTEDNLLPEIADQAWRLLVLFLGYAARRWGRHALQAKDLEGETTSLILEYLSMSSESSEISTTMFYRYAIHTPKEMPLVRSSQLFSSLHIVAYFGLYQVLDQVFLLDTEVFGS
jgi:hypothetical protein